MLLIIFCPVSSSCSPLKPTFNFAVAVAAGFVFGTVVVGGGVFIFHEKSVVLKI